MKYGVIVCPNCKKAKGFMLAAKKTKCIYCNKSIDLDKVKTLFKTNSQEELRKYIGLINAEMDGRLDEFKKSFEI